MTRATPQGIANALDTAIQDALAQVRPMIIGHGGDVEYVGFDNGVVEVIFHGACRACPNIAMTFVGPVRTQLMQIEGVEEVKSDNVHAGPRALARMARLLGAHPY